MIERIAIDGTSDDPKVSVTRLAWGDNYPGELDAVSAAASVTDFDTGAGAHKTCGSDGVFVNGRNSFETRILNNFKNNTGDYVLRNPLTETAQKSVPAPTPGATPYPDANHDGIPGAYALPAGKVATDLRTDGYTFVEGFLWEAEKTW